MKRFAIYLLANLFFLLCLLQEGKAERKGDTNEVYIRTFHEYFYVKLLTAQKLLELNFQDQSVDGLPQMNFKPNIGNYTGFGFFIFDLGVDVLFRTPPGPESNRLYGNSKGRDWQIHAYSRKFAFDLSYQKYEGFYLDNPTSFYPDWRSGDPYPKQTDMEVQVVSLAGLYVFKDEKYSFPAVFNQTEAQLKSAGSFFLSGQINSSNLSDPVSLIPQVDSNQFTGLKDLTNVNVSSLNFLPGYSANIVLWKKVYINLSGAFGFGYQIRNYTAERERYQNNSLGFAQTFRLGAGYNGRRFFIGINGFIQNNNILIEDLSIDSSAGMSRFFIGYRFREWGIMRKSVFDVFTIFSRKKKKDDA